MHNTALIYSPGFDGHRQVYVFVITHVLKGLGFNIFIAGNTKQIISNSFYIDKLRENPEITIIDTSKYAKGGLEITNSEFLKLQNTCKTDLTVFTEADHHLPLFISQIFGKKSRFRGSLVGIFLRPFYYYRKIGMLDKLRYLKRLPSRWKKDERLFYSFFLSKFSLLNVALSIDENFVAQHRHFKWLPDVFQQYAEAIVKDENAQERKWIEKLNVFKENNKGRFHFLYFGTAQYRRGYDKLLNLALETGGCFIHCGLRDNLVNYDYDTDKLRLILQQEGRLFETDQYITDPICIEYFFKSVSHLVLPYRNFFGSSGVMLQALDFGIPILAPKTGIIGYRITNFKLGITFEEEDASALTTQFNHFKELDPQLFESNIKSYMSYQTNEQLKNVFVNTFVKEKESVIEPILQNS